jgi:arylsulfatase A-like enzyme
MQNDIMNFKTLFLIGIILWLIPQPSHSQSKKSPNIIMVMADDLGWGDVGFNGNPTIKTPELDKMAMNAIQFTRFYSGAPVCSPTRGSCLTGRNPERYGILFANVGHMKPEEVTLAETLKSMGYATGHFGKWHLGTLSKTVRDGHRGGEFNDQYSPPWENGFETCFSTEQAVPTWDPMINQMVKTNYWTGPEQFATENLEGDDSRIIMDRALPFIEASVKKKKPFLSVIWFHTPHSPVVAGQKYMDMYPGMDENHQHYYGCITAMDEQIGRLRKRIKSLGIADNTIILFASDNGPAGEGGGIDQHPGKRQQGTSGPFRGRKGSLYEGGVRVPALMEWPAMIREHTKIDAAVSSSDYYPTILSILGYKRKDNDHLLDGTDILPILKKPGAKRDQPIAFKSYKQRALTDWRYKIYSPDDGQHYEMYDLLNDPSETKDISVTQPELLQAMIKTLDRWNTSCANSAAGLDYGN